MLLSFFGNARIFPLGIEELGFWIELNRSGFLARLGVL